MKIQYFSSKERQDIIKEQLEKGMFLVGEANLVDGDFLEFKSSPEPEPQPPSIEEQLQEELAKRDKLIEGLQLENGMLQMGLMEMTMYTASQDERLQTQESALMEISMLVAGGGA